MRQDDLTDGDDADLVSMLQKLELPAACVNAPRIWYEAGKQAGAKQSRRWKVVSLALGVIAAVVAARDLTIAAPGQPEVRYVRVVAPMPRAVSAADNNSIENVQAAVAELKILHAVAERGLDALPMPKGSEGGSDAFAQFAKNDWMADPRLAGLREPQGD